LFNLFLDWNVACNPEVAKQPIAVAYWFILKLIWASVRSIAFR